jgi:(p)ppGpp synthase/HD superfamily hydrolase
MTTLAYDAMLFARQVHQDQRRKYTNGPYADHLAEVAGIVATVAEHSFALSLQHIIATAWLHDCMEDQGITLKQLQDRFGEPVSTGVALLSDMEKGNRAQRKALSRARLANAPAWVQTIKCADLISNTGSIIQHDPKFAVVYLQEKRDLLAVMDKADPRLHRMAMALAQQPLDSKNL